LPGTIPHAGEAAAVATAVSWAFTALLFSTAARRIGASRVNLIRLVLATALLGILVLATGSASRPQAGQVALLVVSGVVGLALGDAAYFRALQILGPRRASLVSPLWPVFSALVALPLLRERIGWPDAAAMALTLGGVLWVQSEGGADREVEGSLGRGLLFGVLGCLGQAGGYVLAKAGLGFAEWGAPLAELAGLSPGPADPGGRLLAGVPVDPLFGTFIRMAAGTAWIVAVAGMRREYGEAWEALKDGRGMWFVVGGTVFGPVLGVWMSLVALRYASNIAVASTILAISPIFVIPLVRLVHGTPITARAVVGSFVAVGGVALLTLL
jgi:drug/metabolite transporter (DMT)-like permease